MDSIPVVVRLAVQERHSRFDDYKALLRAYGPERAQTEFLSRISSGHWIDKQLHAEGVIATAKKIAAANGWNWAEIESACLSG